MMINQTVKDAVERFTENRNLTHQVMESAGKGGVKLQAELDQFGALVCEVLKQFDVDFEDPLHVEIVVCALLAIQEVCFRVGKIEPELPWFMCQVVGFSAGKCVALDKAREHGLV